MTMATSRSEATWAGGDCSSRELESLLVQQAKCLGSSWPWLWVDVILLWFLYVCFYFQY